jgi:hypothetical protein
MKRRSLFFALAAGLVVWGFGALDARATQVPLPTTYNNLLPSLSNPAPFIMVNGVPVGGENLTFSNFTYLSTSAPPGSEIPASGVNVTAYTVGNETGFSLGGAALFAPANTNVDIQISYTVTAPAGESLTDALLSTTGGALNGGTGSYLVSETLTSGGMALMPGSLQASGPGGNASDSITFAQGYQSINVSKDIFLFGGTGGVSVSVITQAFSSEGGVPEPTSLALLGIGMTGFLAFRRFFKKPTAA